MGVDWSMFGSTPEAEVDKYVVVPPILDIDREQRNRFVSSGYEWLCRKREMIYLKERFFHEGASGVVCIHPPTEPGLSIIAKLWEQHDSSAPATRTRRGTYAGGLNVRLQPNEDNPLSFVMLNSNFRGATRPTVSGAYVHLNTGIGCFGNAQLSRNGLLDPQVGLRYSSPTTSAGAVLNAGTKQLDKLWFVQRLGALTVGAQLEPKLPLDGLLADPGDFCGRCVAPDTASVSVGYAPTQQQASGVGGDDSFSFLAEVERGSVLRLSVFQHYARVRRVYNLFEDDDVVGITNYLDCGITVTSSLLEPSLLSADASSLQAVVGWQVNSNVMLKARAGTDKVAAAVVLKSWWNPSFTFAASAGWAFKAGAPRFGVMLNMDTDSELRYERGRQTQPVGSLVRHRYKAAESEVQVGANYRPIVTEAVVPDVVSQPPRAKQSADVLNRVAHMM